MLVVCKTDDGMVTVAAVKWIVVPGSLSAGTGIQRCCVLRSIEGTSHALEVQIIVNLTPPHFGLLALIVTVSARHQLKKI